jgi:dipeptidase E
MKLLLTSTGLNNDKIKEFFVSCFETFENKKACLIHTVREESDWQWMEYYDSEMRSICLEYDAINISEDKNLANLPEYDIYYVCGGNTFYILDRIRKTGLDKVLTEEVQKGKFYLGVSAGSIIVGPDIEAAGIGDADKDDVGLSDLAGLKLTEHIIMPHYCSEEEKDVQDFMERRKGEPVIALTDDQAVFVENGEITRIG